MLSFSSVKLQMDGTDGIETAKRLRQRDEDTILIFITGIREYVFEAFDVAAFHYLFYIGRILAQSATKERNPI